MCVTHQGKEPKQPSALLEGVCGQPKPKRVQSD